MNNIGVMFDKIAGLITSLIGLLLMCGVIRPFDTPENVIWGSILWLGGLIYVRVSIPR